MCSKSVKMHFICNWFYEKKTWMRSFYRKFFNDVEGPALSYRNYHLRFAADEDAIRTDTGIYEYKLPIRAWHKHIIK